RAAGLAGQPARQVRRRRVRLFRGGNVLPHLLHRQRVDGGAHAAAAGLVVAAHPHQRRRRGGGGVSREMPEGLDPILAARLRELAQARGWTPEQAFSLVLERGLMELESDTAADLEAAEAEAL